MLKQAKFMWCSIFQHIVTDPVTKTMWNDIWQVGRGCKLAATHLFWLPRSGDLATRLCVVSVWPICWRLLISLSFFPMLKGWSGPKWWWLSAEITNMRWTIMPGGLWGGRQAKFDVKAGKIYVVHYFPAYCYRSQKLCEMTCCNLPKFICSL